MSSGTLQIESVKRHGNLSSSISEFSSKYWGFQKHDTGIFLGTFPFPAASFTLVFSPFRTMEQQRGALHVCMLGGLSGLEQFPLLLVVIPYIPPASSLLALHAESNTISLSWECLTVISLTPFGGIRNMSSISQPNGQQKPIWTELLCKTSW